MFRQNRKIDRSYDRPFFHKRRNIPRLIFVVTMLALIALIPLFSIWQQDRLQLLFLDQIGYAPTATPFASSRASLGEEFYRGGDIETAAIILKWQCSSSPKMSTISMNTASC